MASIPTLFISTRPIHFIYLTDLLHCNMRFQVYTFIPKHFVRDLSKVIKKETGIHSFLHNIPCLFQFLAEEREIWQNKLTTYFNNTWIQVGFWQDSSKQFKYLFIGYNILFFPLLLDSHKCTNKIFQQFLSTHGVLALKYSQHTQSTGTPALSLVLVLRLVYTKWNSSFNIYNILGNVPHQCHLVLSFQVAQNTGL